MLGFEVAIVGMVGMSVGIAFNIGLFRMAIIIGDFINNQWVSHEFVLAYQRDIRYAISKYSRFRRNIWAPLLEEILYRGATIIPVVFLHSIYPHVLTFLRVSPQVVYLPGIAVVVAWVLNHLFVTETSLQVAKIRPHWTSWPLRISYCMLLIIQFVAYSGAWLVAIDSARSIIANDVGGITIGLTVGYVSAVMVH